MKKHAQTVYGLTDEHGLIRYVGQTCNLQSRFQAHAKNGSLPFSVSGMAILRVARDRHEANEAEKEWVAFFGRDNLCNNTDGGMAGVRASTMTGADLKAWRLAHGLSQEALARLLQVAANTVYRWEAGTRAVHPFMRDTLNGLEKRKLVAQCLLSG